MSDKSNIKPLTIALGAAVGVSLANINSAGAAGNPFSMEPLSGGYMMLAEGKCGEGKCGGKGKGREGGCGMKNMDADGDGNVTHDEFMKGHEVMFDRIDANGDGVIDSSERAAHMAGKKGKKKPCKMGEGKCGEGKCGGSK